MAADLFDIDPRNKLGNAEWGEESDDFATFVDALNRGVTVRDDGVQGTSELPRENELDAIALAELRAKFAGYR